ncbi:MAG: hypothetical protein QME96_00320 [Myxococcota bacterium]|nr:hypothetical protein [Myxococcota bacterium]
MSVLMAAMLALAARPAEGADPTPSDILPSTPDPRLPTPDPRPGGGGLEDLIGEDLAAELERDEEEVRGRAGRASPAAPAAGSDATGGAIGPGRLLNPAISLVGTFAGTYYTNETHVPRGGHVPETTGIHVVEAEFAVEAAVDPYFYLKGYFLFGTDFFEIEEAYVETLGLPGGLRARAGRMRAPFGRLNPRHAHQWKFIDAPLPNQRFLSGEGFSAPGVELGWVAPLPFYLRAVASANYPDIPQPGDVPDERTFGKDEDYDFIYLGRIETFVPFGDEWSLMLGAGALTGPAGQGHGTRSDVFGGDLFLRYKPVAGTSYFEFDLAAEGMFRQRQFPANRLADWAAYAEAMFRLSRRWRIALRGDAAGGDLVRGPTMTGPGLETAEERGTLSVAFMPTEFSLLRLQGALSHPHGDAWTGPEWVGEVHLQLTVSVGAHGAHAF